MIITLRKRQLTFQQRKEIVSVLMKYGLSYVQAVVRHFQCSVSTVWRLWSLFQRGGRNANALLLKPRHSKHPREHTRSEHDLIVATIKQHPNARYNRIYTILCQNGYKRSYKGLWGYISKHNLRGKTKYEYVPRINKPYDTPTMFGLKMQMDVKFVERRFNQTYEQYYQYSIIDEASRVCFEKAYPDKSTSSTKEFLECAFKNFGYLPCQIQTDNGSEFTNELLSKPSGLYMEKKINLVDDYLFAHHVEHKLIPPGTPRQNGKIERLHRENEYDYQNQATRFKNLDAVNQHLDEWCRVHNGTFTFALCPKCRKSPNMRHKELLQELKRFARAELKLSGMVQLQDLIYAYGEWLYLKWENDPMQIGKHPPIRVSSSYEFPPHIAKALDRL
jgi:transposase InsO family protein